MPTGLPAGPSEPPILQTLRWLLRPISFLESCRRRFGDAFSLRLLGFQTPLVMPSDPEVIRALYGNRAHGLPPGRSLALQLIVGPRSLLLLEGGDHLARRRRMLPPFHGERTRAYESTVRDVVARDVRQWPQNEPFSIHPRMQRVTLEVILRAVFGVTDEQRRSQLADHLSRLLADTASVGLQSAGSRDEDERLTSGGSVARIVARAATTALAALALGYVVAVGAWLWSLRHQISGPDVSTGLLLVGAAMLLAWLAGVAGAVPGVRSLISPRSHDGNGRGASVCHRLTDHPLAILRLGLALQFAGFLALVAIH